MCGTLFDNLLILIQRFGEELGYSVSVTEKEFIEAGWPSDLKTKSFFEVYKVASNKNGTGNRNSYIFDHL